MSHNIASCAFLNRPYLYKCSKKFNHVPSTYYRMMTSKKLKMQMIFQVSFESLYNFLRNVSKIKYPKRWKKCSIISLFLCEINPEPQTIFVHAKNGFLCQLVFKNIKILNKKRSLTSMHISRYLICH